MDAGAQERRDLVVSFAIPEGESGPFRLRDIRRCCCTDKATNHPHLHGAFFEMP